MDKLAKRWCRDLDYVLTVPEVRQPTSHPKSARPPLVPGCRGSASVAGHVTTYHRLSNWHCVTNM